MTDLKNYNLPELLDLLSHHTAHHIRVISQSANRQDVETSKATLKKIQAAIEERKSAATGRSFSNNQQGHRGMAE